MVWRIDSIELLSKSSMGNYVTVRFSLKNFYYIPISKKRRNIQNRDLQLNIFRK